MAHANGEEAIMAAAEAGVRSIEHGFFMTERALELIAAQEHFLGAHDRRSCPGGRLASACSEARQFVSNARAAAIST